MPGSKTLLLVRHAKSSRDDPSLDDIDRPLNDRGERDAPMMGKRLAKKGVKPSVIISSPAVRAYDTAVSIARELGITKKKVVTDDDLYTFDAESLLRAIEGLDDGYDTVMLAGHNPAVTGAVNELTDSHIDNVPTCGVAVIDIGAAHWAGARKGKARLLSFDYPKNPSP